MTDDVFEIVPITQENLPSAAYIHSVSWQDSHKAFCTPAFVALHNPEHQLQYLKEKLDSGSKRFLLRTDVPKGIVTVTDSLIEDLYVLPAYQNQGIGTKLLLHAMRVCDAAPTLWILENNIGARRLYERIGFRETGRRNQITDKLDEIEFCFAVG